MTISVVVRFTGADMEWVVKGAAYIRDNTDASTTVLSQQSGDHSGIVAVEEWDSLAAYEAGWKKLSNDPEWQAIFREASGVGIHNTFYNHVSY